MKKRILSLLIALVMVVGLLPTVAFADEGTVGPLQSMINDAANEAEITLEQNYNECIVIPAGKKITLNLNGFTLTNGEANKDNPMHFADTIYVAMGGELTVVDNSESKAGLVINQVNQAQAVFNEGTVILKGGQYRGVAVEIGNGKTQGGYVIVNHGKMTINDGVIVTTEDNGSALVVNGYQNEHMGSSDVLTWRRTQCLGENNPYNAFAPEMEIAGGVFTGGKHTINNDHRGKLTVTGNPTVNVAEGSVNAFRNEATATADITGGTFTGNLKNSATEPAALEITGGTFTGNIVTDTGVNNETIAITGGTFSEDVSNYCADNALSQKQGEDGKWHIVERIPSELKTDIGSKIFKVGQSVEFTFSTIANSDAGRMVIGSSNFSNSNAIETLEYYETKTDMWYPLSGDFGSSTGFPMSDATSRFRVTFKTAGDYSFIASMKLAEGGKELCKTKVEFTVYAADSQVCAVTFISDGNVYATERTGEDGFVTDWPTNPTRSGYTFLGWYLNGEQVGKNHVFTANTTVTAQWRRDNSGYIPPIKPVKPISPVKPEIELPFRDVYTRDWFYDAVEYVYDHDLMDGVGGGRFNPQGETTRGMIVTILYRMAGSPRVTSDDMYWWSDARVWAMEYGVSDGTDMTASITREQLAAMLHRYAKLLGKDSSARSSLERFSDHKNVSTWALAPMQWAVAESIVNGKGNALDPKGLATRAEVAAMIMRFDKLVG